MDATKSIQYSEEDGGLLDEADKEGVVIKEIKRYPIWRILLITLGMFGMEFPCEFTQTCTRNAMFIH